MNRVTFQKKLGKSLLLALILALATGTVPALAAEDITGDWEITMDFGGRQSFAALSIAKKADGTFTGKWGSAELADVKFDGQKLTFVRIIRMQDNEFRMNYEGTLQDGKLAGKFTSDRGEFAANGARTKPRPAVLGQWDLSYKIGERDVTAKLSISQLPDGTLDARWTSGFGESVVSDVKLRDGKLSFARKSKFQDREFTSTFEGVVSGHKLTGTIKSDRGEMAVNGQRVGAAFVGKWELTSTSGQGPRTRLLTVYGDLTGRYEIFGAEIPIKEIKLDGDQVTFNIETGFGDQTFTMEFKGKLDGNTFSGQLTTPNGTRDLTGKKVETASAALVGTWEITEAATTDRPERTRTLKIKEDLSGTYTLRDSEVPIADLKVEGDQVTFKVNMKFNEREVTMEFKCKLDGTTLKGQSVTPRGTREITGKKIN